MSGPASSHRRASRHPRTLDEAFPFGPQYGCAICRHRRPSYVARGLAMAALWTLVLGLIVWVTW